MSRKKWDRLDAEAEREGNAIKTGNYIPAKGKRIIKIRRQHSNGNRLIQTKVEKRYI